MRVGRGGAAEGGENVKSTWKVHMEISDFVWSRLSLLIVPSYELFGPR